MSQDTADETDAQTTETDRYRNDRHDNPDPRPIVDNGDGWRIRPIASGPLSDQLDVEYLATAVAQEKQNPFWESSLYRYFNTFV